MSVSRIAFVPGSIQKHGLCTGPMQRIIAEEATIPRRCKLHVSPAPLLAFAETTLITRLTLSTAHQFAKARKLPRFKATTILQKFAVQLPETIAASVPPLSVETVTRWQNSASQAMWHSVVPLALVFLPVRPRAHSCSAGWMARAQESGLRPAVLARPTTRLQTELHAEQAHSPQPLGLILKRPPS